MNVCFSPSSCCLLYVTQERKRCRLIRMLETLLLALLPLHILLPFLELLLILLLIYRIRLT